MHHIKKRWRTAKRIYKQFVRMGIKDRISLRDVFNRLQFWQSNKGLDTVIRYVKEKTKRQMKRTVDTRMRPYYTYFWVIDKTAQEHDGKGFQYRYIDQPRWRRYIVPRLRKGESIKLYAIYEVDAHVLDSRRQVTASDQQHGDMIRSVASGELNHTCKKLMYRAVPGSVEEQQIIDKWQSFQNIAQLELEMHYGMYDPSSMRFQGFAVNKKDVGNAKVRY